MLRGSVEEVLNPSAEKRVSRLFLNSSGLWRASLISTPLPVGVNLSMDRARTPSSLASSMTSSRSP
ncbi:MAG: hypothetical protein D6733_00925 [Methanobacteriota archaeon]|nr:MAG: hypothetical protein D6733_00925 [Euryarchaeota archaeon]